MTTLDRISAGLARKAGTKSIIIAAAVLVAILAVMEVSPIGKGALKAESGGMDMLDMRFAYSTETVNGMFSALGQDGRMLYVRLLALDVVFAFAFMAFQSFILSALIRRTGVPAPLMRLNLLPVLRSALDLVENAFLILLLSLYRGTAASGISRELIPIASAVTSAKWIVYYAVIATLFIFGAISTVCRKERTR
jgi:hypothetical protein